MMDMHIRLTPIWITCKHKQVVYTRISQSIDCMDNNFQDFLRLKVLKIFDGFDM